MSDEPTENERLRKEAQALTEQLDTMRLAVFIATFGSFVGFRGCAYAILKGVT